jgi:hypothetical protein
MKRILFYDNLIITLVSYVSGEKFRIFFCQGENNSSLTLVNNIFTFFLSF